MGWLAIALVGLLIVVAAVLGLRRQRRRRAEADAVEAVPAGEELQRKHSSTAMSELRDLREALGPATHSRVERRRTPQPGTAPKIERRKKGGRRAP
jgi:hypothetical protein